MNQSYGQLERPTPPGNAKREIRYEHANNLPALLSELGGTLLISTYQAGKLIAVGSRGDQIHLTLHNFDYPMGIAVDPSLNQLAVTARDMIWFAYNEIGVGRSLPEPAATCFLTRSAHVTGDIQAHQIAWAENELWVVNTKFSCLCTIDQRHSFVPRWQPYFIDALVGEDRCHLNGLAVEQGKPKYVTALADTNFEEGWRAHKDVAGCLIDVKANSIIARGFAMPHSPVASHGGVFLLNSGEGQLVRVNARSGDVDEVGRFPGYTRGLTIYGDVAVVGLSKVREKETFGGLPISHKKDLKCGVAIVDLKTGKLLSQFEFKSGVEEIFDVAIVAHPGQLAMRGPHAALDGYKTIWVAPDSSRR